MKGQFEKVVKKAINMIIDIDLYEWPPSALRFIINRSARVRKMPFKQWSQIKLIG